MPESSPLSPAASPRSRADALLAAVVVLFAFLAASFTARNADLWRHLAAGRLVASGDVTFGTDPFSFTADGRYWANHAWLADLGMYLAFTTLGGAALVLLKAVGVAVLAALLLIAGRERGPFWVAGGCVLLAVLAASPRVLLQPVCLSLVLLALCQVLLRSERGAKFLPLVMAAWVNLDEWFVLGLLVVGLRRIGGDARLPPWSVPMCVAACVLSPHHVRAFVLPPELSPAVWRGAFRADPRFAAFFAHPWHGDAGLAGWAFFALVGLGVLSFLVNRRAAIGWRGLMWLAFAALAAWQARLVPFFAVVAGPITAMNFREKMPPDFRNRTGRLLTITAGVALAVLAWQGMLQAFGPGDRGTAWAVHADPTLERVTTTLAKWRADGTLPAETRVFATHPDVADYAGWFARGEKMAVDSRLHLFAPVAFDFRNVSQLVGVIPQPGGKEVALGGSYLTKMNAGCVVLYDPDPRRLSAALREIAGTTKQWELLRVDGAAVVLGWVGAPRKVDAPRFASVRAAFGASPDEQYPPQGDDPPRFGRPFSWWDFAPARGRRGTWEADAAGTYLRMFEESRAAATSADAPNATALPLLAVRAARRGTALDADDAVAWAALGRAYVHLAGSKAEVVDGAAFALLRELRQIQTVTALVQAAALAPESAAAHELLATVFAQRGLFDLALKHGETNLRLVRRAGALAGETAGAFADRVARLTEIATGVERVVQDGENRFLVSTQTLAGNPLARARIALQLGLGEKAIDTLLKSHLDLYGLEGLRMLLDLLLHTGQAEEARVLLDRDELRRAPDGLGFYDLPGGANWAYRLQAYGWYNLCQSAAAGKYGAALAALDRLRADFRPEEERLGRAMAALFVKQLASETGLAAPPASLFGRLLASRERNELADQLSRVRFLAAQRADLHALGGLLLLEVGDPTAARQQFESAAAIYAREKGVAPAVPGQALAARYLQAIDAAKSR